MAAVFLVSLSTLTYEMLITRVFSVTLMYHFAFMAISIAMFGMTAGGIVVYLAPRRFAPERTGQHLAVAALLLGVAIVASFLAHLLVPIFTVGSLLWAYLALTYVLVSIPFFFSGMCICLALTRYAGEASLLYAADLTGAAGGCLAVLALLELTDGPTAVVACACSACLASFFFAPKASPRTRLLAAGTAALLLAFVVLNTALVHQSKPLLRLRWIKGRPQPELLYEKWNSFSRIAVWGSPDVPEEPAGWGVSRAYRGGRRVRQLHMDIDAAAYTPIPGWSGQTGELDYLKYDVTNLAHYLRPGSDVLVIGIGGGRDILSALAFEQASVVGVEINRDIIDVTTSRFGQFTGRPDLDSRVTYFNDEARSYIARQTSRYDIIQASLIDTWAATAAGAYVLSENSLYTVEAWAIFLRHLTPRGILTFSRWFFPRMPGETCRLISLAGSSLKEVGITNPRDHIAVVTTMMGGQVGVATILVAAQPFAQTDLDRLEAVAGELGFSVLLSPRAAASGLLPVLASGEGDHPLVRSFPLRIAAPTDESPFFFHMLRFPDAFNKDMQDQGVTSFNMNAAAMVVLLLLIVLALTLLCIGVPALISLRRVRLKGSLPHALFFCAIGLGFMFIEISQMQRLIVFLGHPVYGLATVLFTLLLSSGLGSLFSRRLPASGSRMRDAACLLALLVVAAVFGVMVPRIVHTHDGASTALRVAIAAGTLFPLGFLMGMPFPLGLRAAARRSPQLMPWLWAMNGATSVCASVLAVAVAMEHSISASFWTGFGCYVAAALALTGSGRRPAGASAPAPGSLRETGAQGARNRGPRDERAGGSSCCRGR